VLSIGENDVDRYLSNLLRKVEGDICFWLRQQSKEIRKWDERH